MKFKLALERIGSLPGVDRRGRRTHLWKARLLSEGAEVHAWPSMEIVEGTEPDVIRNLTEVCRRYARGEIHVSILCEAEDEKATN